MFCDRDTSGRETTTLHMVVIYIAHGSDLHYIAHGLHYIAHMLCTYLHYIAHMLLQKLHCTYLHYILHYISTHTLHCTYLHYIAHMLLQKYIKRKIARNVLSLI